MLRNCSALLTLGIALLLRIGLQFSDWNLWWSCWDSNPEGLTCSLGRASRHLRRTSFISLGQPSRPPVNPKPLPPPERQRQQPRAHHCVGRRLRHFGEVASDVNPVNGEIKAVLARDLEGQLAARRAREGVQQVQ